MNKKFTCTVPVRFPRFPDERLEKWRHHITDIGVQSFVGRPFVQIYHPNLWGYLLVGIDNRSSLDKRDTRKLRCGVMNIQVDGIDGFLSLVFRPAFSRRSFITFFLVFQWCSSDEKASCLGIAEKFPNVIHMQWIFKGCVELDWHFRVTFEKKRYYNTQIIREILHIYYSRFWRSWRTKASIRSRLHGGKLR